MSNDGNTFQAGGSQLSYEEQGRVTASLRERAAPRRAPVGVQMTFVLEVGTAVPIRLVEHASHHWRPIAPRGTAPVSMPARTLPGPAHHDGNDGVVPLGTDCRKWQWVHSHFGEAPRVSYQPWGVGSGIRLVAHDSAFEVTREPLPDQRMRKTFRGLPVPEPLDGAAALLCAARDAFAEPIRSGGRSSTDTCQAEKAWARRSLETKSEPSLVSSAGQQALCGRDREVPRKIDLIFPFIQRSMRFVLRVRTHPACLKTA